MYKTSAPTSFAKKRQITLECEPGCKIMHMNKTKIFLPSEIELYPTQKLMINRILKAISDKENALVEAPTGSGKTLALLSSTCSWLTDYELKRRENKGRCPIHDIRVSKEELELDNEESLDGFDPITKESYLDYDDNKKSKPSSEECLCRPKMRIYYCTRTHKQISQVVKEYKRLPFWRRGTLKHTVLASREHTCINDEVKNMHGDLNSNCKKILEPNNKGCLFRNNLKSITNNKDRNTLRNRMNDGNLKVWDIEDLVKSLTDIRLDVCPYFLTTREFTKDANIIFCPFNYLIDPIIRENSDVYLENSIIILDEAHNIEDICRSAASFEFTDVEIDHSIRNLKSRIEELSKHTGLRQITSFLQNNADSSNKREQLELYCEALSKWHDYLVAFYANFAEQVKKVEKLQADKYSKTKTMNLNWNQLENFFDDEIDLARNPSKEFLAAFTEIVSNNDSSKGQVDTILELNLQLHASTIVCLEKLLFFFKFYSKGDNRTLYKANIEISPEQQLSIASQSQTTDHSTRMISGFVCHLNFWSMLPSISFNEAFSNCHSIILASGTLCPFDTFCGELKTTFKYQMEGQQIIESERIFASSISKGPNSRNLRLTFANMNDSMMFELAQIIFDICNVVPHGVLVFVSSYRVLQQLKSAFYNSGLIRKLEAKKEVFYEPKKSSEMNLILFNYDEAIKSPRKNCDGAVMFAVFRGKVSEGLDFADNKARAVVIVGIPYPSVADQQVLQKRSFNDLNAQTHNIVKGSDWYEIQAYRAVNQALGRCLRHKEDWGALILIDERYSPSQTKISGWIRQQMKSYEYANFCQNLKLFVDFHSNQPQKKPLEDKINICINPVLSRQYKNPLFR